MLASLVAARPDALLAKVALLRPTSWVVADVDEMTGRPRRDGLPLTGRIVWFAGAGGTADVSWRKVVERAGPDEALSEALRGAVVDQVAAFRRAMPGQVECGLCGGPVARDRAHVDHVQPQFKALTDDWLATLGGPAAVTRRLVRPSVGAASLADCDRASWAAFHRGHARLRLVHGSCNLRRGRSVKAA